MGRRPQTALGAAIRHFRQTEGVSQEELAARAGLHRTYVGGVERGERNPSFLSLLRLAEALATPLSEIVLWLEAELARRPRR